jgi:hypothetical protein
MINLLLDYNILEAALLVLALFFIVVWKYK